MKAAKSILLACFFWLNLMTFAGIKTTYNSQTRSKFNFNNEWKFSLTDSVRYLKADYNDSNWRTLNLPHDWSVEFEFSEKNTGRNAFLPGGIGWYRKTFVPGKEFAGKQIEIQFDGIYKDSRIWVNGFPVFAQHDGYTSFYLDITELVHVGEKNTIAVRVDNSVQPNCRWYSGSGIYRNVWLTVTNPTHIETWGTFIATPEVSATEAIVSIQTSIKNIDEAKEITLETALFNAEGKEVTRTASAHYLGRFQQSNIAQNLTVPSPKLWSPSSPYIYSAVSTIKENGVVVDQYHSTFGIRTLTFDADKGFFINGENLKMKGVCLHHDAGVLGAAVPDEVWLRRLKELRAIGCNAIRTSHNPTSPEFMDMCDQLGFLVMDEFVDKWDNASTDNVFFDEPFADPMFSEEWKKNFGETIRRDRNHPSVIMWSVGNENHSPGTDDENHGMKNYGAFVRSMDPTRPVISGMERGKDKPVAEKVNDIIETCRFMDVIALNYGEQWCKLIADKKPGKPYVSTESYVYFNSELEKRFANIERSPWIDVMENDNNMGLFLWVGIDYLGEAKKLPALGTNCGLFDMAGFRKSISYLYEAFWSDKPMVHIEVYENDADDFSKTGRWWFPQVNENWNLEKDAKVDLVTYTNCESVELYLNNKKIGTQKMADFPNWIMKWRKIAYKPGTLKAVGIRDGKAVCVSELKTAGKPIKLVINPEKTVVSPEGVVHVEVVLVDAKGNRVTNDDRKLQFQLEGNGEILGLSNGDMTCHDPFSQTDSKTTSKGKCLCILKTGKEIGDLKLTVEAEGLKTSMINIQVEN